jgi:ABC-type phosphate/phosphonate transport system ATPase subunit
MDMATKTISIPKYFMSSHLLSWFPGAYIIMFQRRTENISILWDEPTGELIKKDTYEIMALLRKVNESGETTCLIKHEKRMVIIFAHRTIGLNCDIKVGEGSPDQI